MYLCMYGLRCVILIIVATYISLHTWIRTYMHMFRYECFGKRKGKRWICGGEAVLQGMYVCVMYVCMYVFMYVCVCMCDVFMYVCIYVCVMYLYMYVCIYVCVCVCMCACMYTRCVYVGKRKGKRWICGGEAVLQGTYVCVMYLCMCVCMHACMHACMHVCVCLCAYIHTSQQAYAHPLVCSRRSRKTLIARL